MKSRLRSLQNELKGIYAVFIKDWKIERRYPVSMVFFAFSPLLWLLPHLIYGTAVAGGRYSAKLESLVGFGDVIIFTGLGLLFMAYFNTSLWGTSYSIRDEEFLGTLDNLYITPISRFSLVLGKTTHYLSQTTVGCSIQLMIICIWYKDSFNLGNLMLASIFILLGILMVQGIAMLFVAFVFWQKEGWRFILVVSSIIYLITPFAFPVIVLPNFLQGIASINPLTFAVEGFRNAFLYGYSFEILRYLLILVVTIPIIITISVILFQFAEKMLRKKALLGQY